MGIIERILRSTTYLSKSSTSLLDPLFKYGSEIMHVFGLGIEWFHLEILIPLPWYMFLLGHHEIILKRISKVNEIHRQEFKRMIFLDYLFLTLVCLPVIVLKLYPTKSIKLCSVMNSLIYVFLLTSFFIQKQMCCKLQLLN